jgi:hypothetical protein
MIGQIQMTLNELGLWDILFNGFLRVLLISFGAYAIQSIPGRILKYANTDTSRNIIALIALFSLSYITILCMDYQNILISTEKVKGSLVINYLLTSFFYFLFSVIIYQAVMWKLTAFLHILLEKVTRTKIKEKKVGKVTTYEIEPQEKKKK